MHLQRDLELSRQWGPPHFSSAVHFRNFTMPPPKASINSNSRRCPPSQGVSIGVYTGWSVGVSEKRGGGGWHEDFAIDLSLGAYVQYNFSPKFGVQANGNYQHGRMDWYLLTYTPNYELTY